MRRPRVASLGVAPFLKMLMSLVCGALVGLGHYLLVGQAPLAIVAGLLGGLGAAAAVGIFAPSR